MNWQDEPWIKLYTRDTVSWKLLPWESKALLLLLLRKVDRAGVMDIGNHKPEHAISAITDMPLEVVETALKPLLDNGTFEVVGNALVCVNFIDAQSTAQSDKARQKASREKRRDVTRRHTLSQNVTDGHETGQNRHNASHRVTNRIEENRREESRVELKVGAHDPTKWREELSITGYTVYRCLQDVCSFQADYNYHKTHLEAIARLCSACDDPMGTLERVVKKKLEEATSRQQRVEPRWIAADFDKLAIKPVEPPKKKKRLSPWEEQQLRDGKSWDLPRAVRKLEEAKAKGDIEEIKRKEDMVAMWRRDIAEWEARK